jgi:hypothetical protein
VADASRGPAWPDGSVWLGVRRADWRNSREASRGPDLERHQRQVRHGFVGGFPLPALAVDVRGWVDVAMIVAHTC